MKSISCINISSNRPIYDDSLICFISDPTCSAQILEDGSIIKLHYQNGQKNGPNHKNWG